MKRVPRITLLCISITFAPLGLTKYLPSGGSMILADLLESFIDWLVAAYTLQNAETSSGLNAPDPIVHCQNTDSCSFGYFIFSPVG